MKGPKLDVLAWVVAGVIAAILLPILADAVRDGLNAALVTATTLSWLRKALLLFAFSFIAGIVSLAAWLSTQPDPPPPIAWQTAFLIGFGWEAALEKLALS